MWRYFGTMQATLERHGGTVEKFIGDAIVAVFGVPARPRGRRAPRRAGGRRDARGARAGQRRARARVRGRIETRRTGVNTGEVIVGGPRPRDQRLATGDAVNVAARLEQAAAAARCSSARRRYASSGMPSSPSRLRRRGEGEEPSRSRRGGCSDCGRTSRLHAPIATPFVGRRGELDELRRAFDTAVQRAVVPARHDRRAARDRQVAPGARGRRSLETGGARRRRTLSSRTARASRTSRSPRSSARSPGRPRAGRSTGSWRSRARPIATRLIIGAIGARDEPGSPEETAWAFRRLFETLAASRPLVVVVDDIHWAEPTLLDLLEYVLGFSSGAPILLLCLARPDLFDARPSWAAPRPEPDARLARAAEPRRVRGADRRADGRERRAGAPRARRRRAEGNPLFVEQMLAMLADDPDAATAVPATIRRSSPPASTGSSRMSARCSSALGRGRLFHRGAVAELLRRGTRTGLGGILLALTRKEFVRPDRSLRGDDGFRFNHVLIRDVAYASMPKELRADLHARLAAWLEAHAGAQLTARRRSSATTSSRRTSPARSSVERAPTRARRPARRLACSDARDDVRSIEASLRLRRSSSAPAASSRSSPRSARRCSPTSAGAPGPERSRPPTSARRGDRGCARATATRRPSSAPRWSAPVLLHARAPGSRRSARHRAAGDRRLRADRQRRRPRRCLAAHGPSPSSPRATGERSSWRSSAAASTRSRPATSAARSRRGTRSAARCSSGGRPSARCSRSSTRSSPGRRTRPRRRRGGRAARRPVPLRAPRPLRRGARAARALEGDLPRARHRVRARGGPQRGSRDGGARRRPRAAERELRDAIDVATKMGASRYVALYRTSDDKGHLRIRGTAPGCRRLLATPRKPSRSPGKRSA